MAARKTQNGDANVGQTRTKVAPVVSAPFMVSAADLALGVLQHANAGRESDESLTDDEISAGTHAENGIKRSSSRKSVKLLLETKDAPGQYMLNTDDLELRNLLKDGLERSKDGTVGQKPSRFSDIVLKKQFTAFDRQNTGELPSFHGFFSLFWIGVALLLIRIAAKNWRLHGSVFGKNEIVTLMLSRDVVLLGFVDCVMMSMGAVSVLLQKLVLMNYISWYRTGWIIQNCWQTLFLLSFIGFSRLRKWPWTHAVFITLHAITMLMKQHSYAFYNGYLSEVYKRREVLEQKLQVLESSAVSSPGSPSASAHATSYFDVAALGKLSRRRRSVGYIETSERDDDIAAVATAIKSDDPLSYEQLRSLRKLIAWEIGSLSKELRGTCKVTANHYPGNLTFQDYFVYIPLPTLVYELEYPRQDSINWYYVAEKATATFGVLFVMIIVSTAHIYPIVLSILQLKEDGLPLAQRLKEFPWAWLDLLFPLMMEYLLSWYVIWECVLNVLAELTCFADRGFYSSWWNSASWDAYARDWNRPVHNFLLRFAYHSSISSWKISRTSATLLTFLLSACVHELVMAVIFGKIRGYLLLMQMMQLPLVTLSKSKILKGRDILGNIQFWIGIFLGPSFLCSLYLFL